VNREIDKINVAINAKYRELIATKGQATAVEVKNACQGTAASQETLLKIYREHNEAFEKRIGVNRTKNTYLNYHYGYTSLERFIREKYHVSDLSFRQLDCSFIENYDYFLRIDCRMQPATVVLKMIYLKKMIKIAIRKRIIHHNPFEGYCAERPKPKQKYLPAKEMKKLMKTPLKSSALEVTRDMFVFSCFTGLCYIDLYHLSYGQIEKEDDGFLWVKISRQKTDSEVRVPLLDEALRLIEKYRGTGCGDKVFPMKSASHTNRQLKKIAKQCGIERRLTFHMSRHTFATETCLSQGVSLEAVKRLMGHLDLGSTEIYAKTTHDKMNEDMQSLSEIIGRKYVLAS